MKKLEKFECGLTLCEVKRIFKRFELECGYSLDDYDLERNFVIFVRDINSDLSIVVDLQTFRIFKYEGSVMQGWSFRYVEFKYLTKALESASKLIDLQKEVIKLNK